MGKRNKKRTIYAVIFSIMFLSLVMIVFLLLFQVRKIKVVGNEYTSEKEIVSWLQMDELATNSVYLMYKFHFTEYELPVDIESVKVQMKSPWSIQVKVKEKKIAGGLRFEEEYIYFDEKGVVLERTSKQREDVYCVEGLSISGAELYQKLLVKEEDKRIFHLLGELSEALQERELTPDKIQYQEQTFYLYFGKVCVNLGNTNLSQRVAQIPPILEKLEDQKGTLHLENYAQSSSTVSFEKNVLPDKKKRKNEKAE